MWGKRIFCFGLVLASVLNAVAEFKGSSGLQQVPFMYGAQYYRAPTPEKEHWESDLKDLKSRGFTTVKYWVQWRWSERREGEYYWEDLDELMALADRLGLKVVLNLILDVMPEWVERDYPDSLMVDAHGSVLHGKNILCRQLGGYPGPCYAHKLMTEKRQRFARAAYAHFKNAPALIAWDVWNEPERDASTRSATGENGPALCFCQSCQAGFRDFCRGKYASIGRLNRIWGRCYTSFDAVEVPRQCGTVRDFVDWREYEMKQLQDDAKWRLELLRETDPRHVAHVHIVPDVGGFNPLTAVDDFETARLCDIYGASMIGDPYNCAQMISCSQGRLCYNAEWHINWGRADMYPRVIARDYFLCEQLSQLGWGVKGYLYWQYRTETLGTESPAWGMLRIDGAERPTLTHATEFWKAFAPYADRFLKTVGAKAQVAIWKSYRNEFYQVCRYGKIDLLQDSLRHYVETLYKLNVDVMTCDTQMIEEDALKDVKLVILPQAMYLERRDAEAFKRLAAEGKVILSEANLGAYDGDRNRFSARIPGFGLSEAWGIREDEMTAAFHLPAVEDAHAVTSRGADDVSKAMVASGVIGSDYFPLVTPDGVKGYGAKDFLKISVDADTEVLASFLGAPVIVRKGNVFYAGTQFGLAAKEKGGALFEAVLGKALAAAGIARSDLPKGLRRDVRLAPDGTPEFVIYVNRSGKDCDIEVGESGKWTTLFGNEPGVLKDGTARMYVRCLKCGGKELK